MRKDSESIVEKPYYCAALSMVKNSPHNAYALDIGCGENPCFFDEHVSDYIGIDICTDTLKKVMDRLPGATLLRASGSNVPFKNDVFDLVICTEVLEHLEDPRSMIKEISRVLTRGGKAILSIPSLSLPQTLILWIAYKTRKISGKPLPKPRPPKRIFQIPCDPTFREYCKSF